MSDKAKLLATAIVGISIAAQGCNYKNLVFKSSYILVDETVRSFYEEEDTILAKQAAPANLKLIEGIARGAPDNADIQLAASQLIGMYAFGFLEDSTEDEELQGVSDLRARKLYQRAIKYSKRALQTRQDFEAMLNLGLPEFEKALEKFNTEDAPALYWTAFSWGLYINLSRGDIAAVAELPKVNAIANRVIELDEGYFYGGAFLILMVYNGILGPALGGSPEKTKKAYERAWRLCDEKFLMAKYLFAKYYCPQNQNIQLFEKLLNEIINAPVNLFVEQNLSNALAKEKARRLLNKMDDFF